MVRTKKTVVTQVTREQAEQAFAEFAAADAKFQNLTSKMDLEITQIREKYADRLAELGEAKARSFDVMQSFCRREQRRTLCPAQKYGIGTWRIRFPYRNAEAEKPERIHLGGGHQPGEGVAAGLYPCQRGTGERSPAGGS